MNQALAKYTSRSPRYILQPLDQTLIRLAGPLQTPWEEGTSIRDISLTGVAFTAPLDLCPTVGEHIRIEFTLPGSTQPMACFALVTRSEIFNNQEMLVAVHFEKINMQQRLLLAQTIAIKLKQQSQSIIKWYDFARYRKMEFVNFMMLFITLLGFYLLFNWMDLIEVGSHIFKKLF